MRCATCLRMSDHNHHMLHFTNKMNGECYFREDSRYCIDYGHAIHPSTRNASMKPTNCTLWSSKRTRTRSRSVHIECLVACQRPQVHSSSGWQARFAAPPNPSRLIRRTRSSGRPMRSLAAVRWLEDLPRNSSSQPRACAEMPRPRCITPASLSSPSFAHHLEEQIGNQEAQQTQRRHNLHRHTPRRRRILQTLRHACALAALALLAANDVPLP